jgi:hypothetical protein
MQELPVDWNEIEKSCIAGVPMHQVAQAMAEKAGVETQRLYNAIRKRCSREQWPVPDAIVRRARLKAKVASGVAENAKKAAVWGPGESGVVQVQQSREIAGTGVPRRIVDGISRESSPNETKEGEMGQIGAGLGLDGGRGALQSAPVTATELVTRSLAERGQSGLSLALDAALASLASLDPATPVPIRSMTDLLTAVKATKEAAGLDKPAVAVAVSLNSAGNAAITAWESLDSV